MKRGVRRLCIILTVLILIEVVIYKWPDQKVSAKLKHLNDIDYYNVILSDNDKEVKPMNVPLIQQLPELPRGCEVTSLAMLLRSAGVKADKIRLAQQIKKDPTPYKNVKGSVYFGDPNQGFVGNMYDKSQPGLGVYHQPIFQLAKQYLHNRVIDMTGEKFNKVEEQLSKQRPVWVITSVSEQPVPQSLWQTWHTEDGLINITRQEHSVVLTGYDENYVYFNDPLDTVKNKRAAKKDFISVWKQFGSQAISYN
ncbi:hypothetical protein GCM10011391_04600 [Pullulanibacillus camelliae]|uniref:Peptidase C39-like domain-containing protein n=1 Tax=Pullulanibacillus camelliae TaxID=1707096 RepID=A0A8J2VKJ4_9BACL|nr:C39 family peptidase [Pullulanibacillus camelliae]GGE29161.1 hypothetical protein GCM10011391_04600 [Pullulanibacillus camelliae]